ncbi:MAG: FAA hydrolase family protein [Clostridia bacterium]|nr:FAA hydrolase family protein [Clostridia bacterium]
MKYVRIEAEGTIRWGVIEDSKVRTLAKAPFEEVSFDGGEYPLDGCRLLAPCEPSKIVCVGKNYHDHAVEMGAGIPDRPILFMKTPNCVNTPGGAIHAPEFVERLDYEGELAFVVKKHASHVKAADYAGYILGYTCLNDVTARDIQKADGQWTRGKCMDGFAPIGPWITDEVDGSDLAITTRLNGNTVQNSRTSMFMTRLPELMEFITACISLEPGDVVTTGTPAGVGPMKSGDTVEVEIEGIGTLRNHVI